MFNIQQQPYASAYGQQQQYAGASYGHQAGGYQPSVQSQGGLDVNALSFSGATNPFAGGYVPQANLSAPAPDVMSGVGRRLCVSC